MKQGYLNIQPISLKMDFSGLLIEDSMKQRLMDCLRVGIPFGLMDEENGTIAVFLPKEMVAVFVDGKPTVLRCESERQFYDAIGLAVLTHRKFETIPMKQLEQLEKLLN